MNNQIPSSRQAVVSGVDFTMVPSWYRFLVNLAQDGASQPPTGPAGGRLDGTYPDPTLKNTGVSPGTYGSPTTVPSVTVSPDGTISFASNTTTGVTPGTYGDATHAPLITVQLDGRLSAAGTVAIVGGADKQVQYNNGGVLAGSTGLVWDNSPALLTATNIKATQSMTAPVFAAGSLPSPSAGAIAFVNDANTTLVLGLGTPVVGGGGNFVPVFGDGSNWIIG